jgi:hypothetical protein
MGRSLLSLVLLALVALAAGCTAEARPVDAASRTLITDGGEQRADSHSNLPCTACHTGGYVGERIASVPRESCAAAGCHQEGGPPQVSTKTAVFQHRDHARDSERSLSCAGCHTHSDGREALTVSVDACALCHMPDLGGGEPASCRLCHQQPHHVALTSQGMPIPHSALPWIETGCSRCHYDVAAAPIRVVTQRCATCHGRDTALVARAAGTDLHPSHTSVNCTSCHQSGTHQVRAMSSAVQLACADCHVREHDVELPGQWRDARTCNSCHETVHQAQQRLLLGVLPGAVASPSSKFVAGMTCRSCHIRTPATVASGAAIRGQAEACASCHQSEYRRVLDWWVEGTQAKTQSVRSHVARAQADLAGVASDSVRALLESSAATVALVAEAGGQHNLELSDRIFRDAVDRVRRAYVLAGRVPPQPPVLGSPAHEGMCSFCHYSPNDPWDFSRMSDRFHKAVVGGGR